MLPSLNLWLNYFHCSLSKYSCVLVCTLNPDFWDYADFEIMRLWPIFGWSLQPGFFQIIINPSTFEKNVLQCRQKRGWFTDLLNHFLCVYFVLTYSFYAHYNNISFSSFFTIPGSAQRQQHKVHTERNFTKPSCGFWGPKHVFFHLKLNINFFPPPYFLSI